MSREEEKIKAANNYCIDARLGYPRVMDDTDKLILKAYLEGVNWADQHPRKGLVDIEKACEWLSDYIKYFNFWEDGTQRDVEEFRKAMEE